MFFLTQSAPINHLICTSFQMCSFALQENSTLLDVFCFKKKKRKEKHKHLRQLLS